MWSLENGSFEGVQDESFGLTPGSETHKPPEMLRSMGSRRKFGDSATLRHGSTAILSEQIRFSRSYVPTRALNPKT